MSSTGRGYTRHMADYYVTPQSAVSLFLREFCYATGINLSNQIILDPCAGGSEIDEMSYPAVLEKEYGFSKQNLATLDIRQNSPAEIKADYLKWNVNTLDRKPDVIMSNPPFSIAVPFILKALDDVRDGGYVTMLQRLNFFGSQERKLFFDNHMPEYCFVHHIRMNFIPKWLQAEIKEKTGKRPNGDSIEYAHYVWRKGQKPTYTKLRII